MSHSESTGGSRQKGVLSRLRQWRDVYLTIDTTDPVVRSRGRTLLWSLLFLTLSNMSSVTSLWILVPDEPAIVSITIIEIIIQVVYFAGIWLSRRGKVEAGALLTSGLVGLSLLLGPYVYGGVPVVYFLSYIPLVLAAATLSPRNIVLTCVVHVVLGNVVYHTTGGFKGQGTLPVIYMVMWTLMTLVICAVGFLQATMMRRTFAEIAQMHEIKQRLELEKTIAERDRLSALHHIAEQESRAKSRFLATMSHELRTPLNAIIGYSELIQEEYEESVAEADPALLDDLGHVLSSGRHLLGLIDDVLDLARVEAGEMTFSRESFPLHELLEECVASIRPMVEEGVEVKLRIEPDTPETCVSDRVKLQQILLNLLGNASKFTHSGEIILVAGQTSEGMLELRVEDTGIGIAKADQELIFEAFKQVDSSTTRSYEGTGLGLSLCKRLAEFLGGKILLDSELGKGSTFTLLIPCDP